MKRLLMLVALGGLVVPFSACSDDDGKDKDKAGDEPTSVITNDKKTDEQLVVKTTKCDAQVSTTGDYEAEWKGEAQVRTGGHEIDATGPAAVYTFKTRDTNQVTLYSSGKEFSGSIALFADGLSYSSDPADAESFDIDERGKAASVDTTLTSISGSEIGLVAEFTCGGADK